MYNNIMIKKYSTGKWLTKEQEVKEALKDILINHSDDYSFNQNCANQTVKYFNIIF